MFESLLQTALPLATAAVNPNTGDRNSTILWIVIAALIVSAGVVIGMLASSRGKKKKNRRK